MKTFRQYLSEQLRDPEFAREHELVTEELALGVQLALRREQVGLTQQQLAERTAIKQPMIARIEHGQVPTLQTLQRLAAGLDSQIIISAGSIKIVSTAREMLAVVTARSPFPAVLLPSVTFPEPRSDTMKTDAKKMRAGQSDKSARAVSSSKATRNSTSRATVKRRAKKAVKN